jgi:phage terminase large subunit-like protein
MARDMTALAYRQEIEAEDSDESPGALWKRDQLEALRLAAIPEGVDLRRIVVGVDPPGGRTECGIVVAGIGTDGNGYVLADYSQQGSPDFWGNMVVGAYYDWDADKIVAEKNFGGDMVEHVLKTADGGEGVRFRLVNATRGKAIRAEPQAAQYERLRVHHIGSFPRLEDEMCEWEPDMGMPSPNRLDALVWALTELMPIRAGKLRRGPKPAALRLRD